MSDTSLVFNVLVKDKASAAFNKLKGAAQSVGDAVSKSLKQGDAGHLTTEIEKSKSKLRDLAAEFDKTGNKNLFKDMRRERSNLAALQAALGEVGSSGFQSFLQGAQGAAQGVSNVASNVWNLIPALLSLAEAATFAGPAISLVGGAIGSLPALATGGGFALGAVTVGFLGIADAFKATKSAGSAVVDNARQIATAERQVRDAQRQVLAAQLALTRAREDASKKMRDQSLSLRQARIDEQQAVFDLHDAEVALQRGRMGGATPEEVNQLQAAYERQKLAVEETAIRTADLTVETERATKAGVEGSDEVTAAKERQRQAEEQLADAQSNLADVQRRQAEAASGAADEVMRLAPAAQAVVDKIKALKPAFEDLRLDVQQQLFAGLSGEIERLSTAWLPTLRTQLGRYADTFNGLIKTFSQTVSTPSFIANINTAADSARVALDKLGQSVAGPLTTAFGQLAGAAKPFIDALGDEVSGLVTDFASWIDKASQSGDLQRFFDTASDFLRDVFDMGRDVGGIIADVVSALFGTPTEGKSSWESLKDTLHELKLWFDDPDNQTRIKDWFDALGSMAQIFLDVSGWIGDVILWLDDLEYKVEDIGYAISDFATKTVPDAWNSMIKWLEGLGGRISKATSGMWTGIKDSFRSTINDVIAAWNNLDFTIGGGSFLGRTFPSFTLSTPNIPYLANGGIAAAAGAAIVGERGPELLDLPRGARVTPLPTRSSSGVTRVELEWVGDQGGDEFMRWLRKNIRIRGGLKPALGE